MAGGLLFDRGSDKILYLPAISLGVLSYFEQGSFSLLSFLNINLTNIETAFLYVVSTTVVLIFLDELSQKENEDNSDSQKLIDHIFSSRLDFLRFLVIGVAIAFTLVTNFYVLESLQNLIQSVHMSSSVYLLSFSLLVGHLIFFSDLFLGMLLSKSFTEDIRKFSYEVQNRFMGNKDIIKEN